MTTNNRMSTFVNVLAGGLNVLYIEGLPPRVDTRFLRRSLDASPDINVDYLTLSPGDPAGRSRRAIQAGQVRRLRPRRRRLDGLQARGTQGPGRSGSRGAGLVMLGGFHTFGAGGYADTPLADVLPIRMSRFERQKPGEPDRPDLHLPGPLRMRPSRFGMDHFALMLSGDRQKNLELWDRLPPLDGANRFGELKPGAVPLAVDDRDDPLLVSQSFGGGRVMAFAGDSTWHWWMQRLRAGPQTVLATNDPLAGPQGRRGRGQRVDPAGAAAARAGHAAGVHRRRAIADRRPGGRREVRGRGHVARRRDAPVRLARRGETWTGVVRRDPRGRRLRRRRQGVARTSSLWARPGRGSSCSRRTWNWTTPRRT